MLVMRLMRLMRQPRVPVAVGLAVGLAAESWSSWWSAQELASGWVPRVPLSVLVGALAALQPWPWLWWWRGLGVR